MQDVLVACHGRKMKRRALVHVAGRDVDWSVREQADNFDVPMKRCIVESGAHLIIAVVHTGSGMEQKVSDLSVASCGGKVQRRQLMLIPGGDRGVVVDELLRCFELAMTSCVVQCCATVLVAVVGPPSFVKKFTDAVLMAMHGGVAHGGEMIFGP